MPKEFRYKTMEIEKEKDGFTWGCEQNFYVSGNVRYAFPLIRGNMVKYFKTEMGAKRNLIKRFEDCQDLYFNK